MWQHQVSALLADKERMYGLDRPQVRSQVFQQRPSRPATSKVLSTQRHSSRFLDTRNSTSPPEQQTLITALRPCTEPAKTPIRLNVKSARSLRPAKSAKRPAFNMMNEMVRIGHQKEALREYALQPPGPCKRHPSVIESIRPASYRLNFNNMFRTGNTTFSIFSHNSPPLAIQSQRMATAGTSGDTDRSLDKSVGAIDSIRQLQRQSSRNNPEPLPLRNFQFMSIKELKKHEKGILNLFEEGMRKRKSHNKTDEHALFDIKLTSEEYESIFDGPPSFYEKKAFIETFRRKWREDHGHCSLFDRRGFYKEARDNYTVAPRWNYRNMEKVLNPSKVLETLNSHFSASVLGGQGIEENVIDMRSQTMPDFYKPRTGLPKNGLRRSLKPSQQGKNFTLSGQSANITQRPKSSKLGFERPKSKYERALRETEMMRQSDANRASSLMMAGSASQGNVSQVVTYHESDAASPPTGSRGMQDSQEKLIQDADIVSMPRANLRDSVATTSQAEEKKRTPHTGSIASKNSSVREEDAKVLYFKVEKRGSKAEMGSEISGGSSVGYPFLQEGPLSGKTMESQDSFRVMEGKGLVKTVLKQ